MPFRLTSVCEIAKIQISSVIRYSSGKMVQMFLPHTVQLRLLGVCKGRVQIYCVVYLLFMCKGAQRKYVSRADRCLVRRVGEKKTPLLNRAGAYMEADTTGISLTFH